jgi:hypothetical protein
MSCSIQKKCSIGPISLPESEIEELPESEIEERSCLAGRAQAAPPPASAPRAPPERTTATRVRERTGTSVQDGDS